LLLLLVKKFLGKRQSRQTSSADIPTTAPEQIVERIKQGDLRLRNQFITDYQPFIAKVTSQFCKRYIDPSRDDEFSIAMNAFNEAINQYDSQKGRPFLSFSETVIRRRLIDYLRKEQRLQQTPFSSFEMEDEEENIVNPLEIRQAVESYEYERIAEERRSEIIDLDRRLMEFDIRFGDLVEASPKHVDSRQTLFSIGRMLAEERELMDLLQSKKMLPIKELMARVKVSRKTLERNRKYIIAIALIYSGSYPYLQEYLRVPDQRVRFEERSQGDE